MLKRIFGLTLLLTLTSTLAMAGAPAVSGDYVEVRSNHILGGGCTYSSEVGMDGDQAILAWRIAEGDLAGLSVVAVVLGEGNLGLGHHARTTVLFVDAGANAAQQHKLAEMFTARYADIFGTVKAIESADITFRHTGENAYEVVIPGQVNVVTRTMTAMDHEPNCDRLVWYTPFTNDADATLAQTVQHAYIGDLLASTWSVPNKRSAYVGAFSFVETVASK